MAIEVVGAALQVELLPAAGCCPWAVSESHVVRNNAAGVNFICSAQGLCANESLDPPHGCAKNGRWHALENLRDGRRVLSPMGQAHALSVQHVPLSPYAPCAFVTGDSAVLISAADGGPIER